MRELSNLSQGLYTPKDVLESGVQFENSIGNASKSPSKFEKSDRISMSRKIKLKSSTDFVPLQLVSTTGSKLSVLFKSHRMIDMTTNCVRICVRQASLMPSYLSSDSNQDRCHQSCTTIPREEKHNNSSYRKTQIFKSHLRIHDKLSQDILIYTLLATSAVMLALFIKPSSQTRELDFTGQIHNPVIFPTARPSIWVRIQQSTELARARSGQLSLGLLALNNVRRQPPRVVEAKTVPSITQSPLSRQLMIGQHYDNLTHGSHIIPYSIVRDSDDYSQEDATEEIEPTQHQLQQHLQHLHWLQQQQQEKVRLHQQLQQQQEQHTSEAQKLLTNSHDVPESLENREEPRTIGASSSILSPLNHNTRLGSDEIESNVGQSQEDPIAMDEPLVSNPSSKNQQVAESKPELTDTNLEHDSILEGGVKSRALLPLDSNHRLRLPQMQQIKARFNQGCVGGTKCQFFAFCWMSGGSLGASCGLLMTCCVTPSRQEIRPGFYGPVVNDPYCGRSTSKINRIVGGTDASFGQFPWQAFVQVGGSRCGGALISSRHVVTAGHCVARSQHSPASIKVTLGDYILNSDIESIPHEIFSVVEVFLHPNFRFTPQADRYDVAVLELDRQASYKDNIKPICLPQKDATFVGRVAHVAGWGALQAGSKLRPKVLQHVAVPVIENQVCESWHRRKGIDIRIYDEMMCAGYEMGQRDACQGDSGGPLMLNQFGVWYLVGIVSAGYSCAKQYQPGIYHRVSSSSDWISSNIYQQVANN